jgi:hypothetical protein
MFQNINFAEKSFKPYNPEQSKLYRRKLALKIKALLENASDNPESGLQSTNMTDEQKALSN